MSHAKVVQVLFDTAGPYLHDGNVTSSSFISDVEVLGSTAGPRLNDSSFTMPGFTMNWLADNSGQLDFISMQSPRI